jgi:hypothetical protein
MRHAVETDHVAAVAALVDREDGRPGLVGASWGVGHSLPVATVGLAFLLLGIRLPTVLVSAVEAVVGLLLVVLGVRLLVGEFARLRHGHADAAHDHISLGPLLVGLTHSHRTARTRDRDDDGSVAPSSLDHGGFAVGAVHGLAGSGALVVALVAAAPSVGGALAFLGGFSVLSVVTMAVVSALWGRALDTRGRRLLVPAAGVVGVVVGLLLLADVGGVASLFVG